MKLILHDYRRCPFCIRTRIVLFLKDVSYEVVNEPLREWTPWMLENVKKPRVPILRIINDDGSEIIMPESNDINLWLDANYGAKTFTPPEGSAEYTQMITCWDWCSNIFKKQIDLYKYGKNMKFNHNEHITHTKALEELVQKLEDRLQNNLYLLGDTMTLADIAVIPFVRQIMRTRNGEFSFDSYPMVQNWSGQILGQDWFNDIVMAKRT